MVAVVSSSFFMRRRLRFDDRTPMRFLCVGIMRRLWKVRVSLVIWLPEIRTLDSNAALKVKPRFAARSAVGARPSSFSFGSSVILLAFLSVWRSSSASLGYGGVAGAADTGPNCANQSRRNSSSGIGYSRPNNSACRGDCVGTACSELAE